MSRKFRALTDFERRIKVYLARVPKPKYKLWQLTEAGQIVGCYWQSVDVAFEDQGEPGWIYVVESSHRNSFISEDSIALVDS